MEYVTVWDGDQPSIFRGEKIVRCKRCKKAESSPYAFDGSKKICTAHGLKHTVEPNEFCSRGEE